MSEVIGDLINQKEAEFVPLCSRMDELKSQFIKQSIDFAVEWYKQTAKQYITKHSEITLKMHDDRMARMKLQFNELIRNTQNNAKNELENPKIWWHLKPRPNESIELYLQVGDKYPEILDRAVRHVLGKLGLILEEYHYSVTASGNTGSYEEFWFDRPLGEGSTVVPYFPHLLVWSDTMQETIKKYNALYLKALALFSEIQELKSEKKRQQAMNRWDLT